MAEQKTIDVPQLVALTKRFVAERNAAMEHADDAPPDASLRAHVARMNLAAVAPELAAACEMLMGRIAELESKHPEGT